MVTHTLDPFLERLMGRHLRGCPIWRVKGLVDADVCECPSDPDADVREAMFVQLAALMPLPLGAASVASRIRDVARYDPVGARATADRVVRQVLARIASGQESPELVQRLAAAALVVGGGWRS